ncbi:MAG: thermonuclease family protein, partial [Tepidisphaeraceae bacterium]
MIESSLKNRARIRRWTTVVLTAICAASIADRTGLFAYTGDDWRRFDHRQFRVDSVTTADTVIVGTTTVRLLGVVAPAEDSKRSASALTYTVARLRNRTVTLRLDPVQTRSAQRELLAYCYITDSDCLNADMIRDGHAYA